MRPIEAIEKQIRQLQDHTTAKQDHKTLNDIYSAMEGSTPAGNRLDIWRIIMKNRLARTIAAAIIIVGVLFGFEFFGKQIGGSSVALADITETMKKVPWLHGVIESKNDPIAGRLEAWMSFESEISATVRGNGEITFADHKKHIRQTYDPATETITVSYVSTDEMLQAAGSPLGLWQGAIEQVKGTADNYTKEVTRQGNIETQSYRMETSPFGGPMEVILVIDTETSLPVGLTQRMFDQDNTLNIEANASFDYPDQGPKDIYSIGAPRGAKILNKMPDDDILPVIELFKSHRQACPSHYIAVVFDYWIHKDSPVAEQVSVVYRDGKKQRVEYYAISQKNRDEFSLNRKQYKEEMGESFDTLFAWWTQGKMSMLGSVDMFDGKYQHQVRIEDDKYKRLPRFLTLGNDHRGDDDLADFGWHVFLLSEPASAGPEQGLLEIVTDEYSKKHDLICLEKKTQGKIAKDSKDTLWATPPKRIAYYLNPSRDYICQMYEQEESYDAPWQIDKAWLKNAKDKNFKKQSPYSSIKEVVEFGQTADGKWYPKVIKRTNPSDPDANVNIKKIFLKENPKFPEKIFDTGSLPK